MFTDLHCHRSCLFHSLRKANKLLIEYFPTPPSRYLLTSNNLLNGMFDLKIGVRVLRVRYNFVLWLFRFVLGQYVTSRLSQTIHETWLGYWCNWLPSWSLTCQRIGKPRNIYSHRFWFRKVWANKCSLPHVPPTSIPNFPLSQHFLPKPSRARNHEYHLSLGYLV